MLGTELRHLKVRGLPKDSMEDIYYVFIKNDASLFRPYPAVMIIKGLTTIKLQE